MEGMEAVLDAPETIEVESQEGVSTGESGKSNQEGQQAQTDDPYSSKASKEYSQWLKGLKDSDPANAKYARLAKDNHGTLFALKQMEPRGFDGVRETYALLDSVVHGELKGRAALGAIQDELRSIQQTDERLLSGDVEALQDLGDDFMQKALPKLAGPILDMVRQNDPAAYAAAVLPHFVDAIAKSDLVANYNSMVDVLTEQPPKWLTEGQKAQWVEERIGKITSLASGMGTWLNAQAAKVGELPRMAQGAKPGQATKTPEQQQLEQYQKQEEQQHWKTNINPKLDDHANKKFDELYRPFAKRLRLDANATNALKKEFVNGVTSKANANSAYSSQMQRYNGMKKPDPSTVLNFAKVEFDRHAKTVFESAVNQRYGSFLRGRPNTAAQTTASKPNGAIAPKTGVRIVTVKPSAEQIDYRATKPDMIHDKIYVLKDGTRVQVRR